MADDRVPPARSPRELAGLLEALRANIGRVFLGKPEVVRLAAVALLADGHLLLDDVPGVGKTLLAKALARSLACKFSRIQFTPDLLPGDLIGVTIYRAQTGEFVFQPGPVFAEVVLADEDGPPACPRARRKNSPPCSTPVGPTSSRCSSASRKSSGLRS